KGHTTRVTGVAFSPDGKRLASAGGTPGEPGAVKVWDAQTGKELFSVDFEGRRGSIEAFDIYVAFSPDGKLLASTEGGVKVLDADTGNALFFRSNKFDLGGARVVFSPDGKRLARGGVVNGRFPDGRIGPPQPQLKVWDVQTRQLLRTIEGGGPCVAFSPDGK